MTVPYSFTNSKFGIQQVTRCFLFGPVTTPRPLPPASNSRKLIIMEQMLLQPIFNLHNVTLGGAGTLLSGSGVWVAIIPA